MWAWLTGRYMSTYQRSLLLKSKHKCSEEFYNAQVFAILLRCRYNDVVTAVNDPVFTEDLHHVVNVIIKSKEIINTVDKKLAQVDKYLKNNTECVNDFQSGSDCFNYCANVFDEVLSTLNELKDEITINEKIVRTASVT